MTEVTVDFVFQVLGTKEVELAALRLENLRLNRELEELRDRMTPERPQEPQ